MKLRAGYLKITDENMRQLEILKEKTGIGALALLSQATTPVPEGLKAKMIDNWMQGRLKTAFEDHLEFVFKQWQLLPQYEFAEITPEIHKNLIKLKRQSGIGAGALLRNTRKERPEGLSSIHINRWLKGSGKKVRKDYLDYVLERWEILSVSSKRRIPLTKDMIGKLKYNNVRSGVSPEKLLKNANKVPEGLNFSIIAMWLCGNTETAQKNYWEFVLDLWETQPRIKPYKMSGEFKDAPQDPSGKIIITNEILNRLKIYRKNTGIAHKTLLKEAANVPVGLTYGVFLKILSGTTKAIKAEHLDFILEQWQKPVAENKRILLSKNHLETLVGYRKEGMLPSQILEEQRDVPKGLKGHIISSWLDGKTKSAEKEHLNYVFQRCEAYKKLPNRRIEITSEMRKDLMCESDRTNLGPKKFLDRIKEYPEDISESMISGWIHGRIQTAQKNYFDFVLREWERL